MTRTVVAIVLVALVCYGVIKALPLISGPSIRIDVPTDYTTFPDGFITLTGRAFNTETLTLNGGILPIDPEGNFKTTLTLPKGGAILTLTAKDRFGRTNTVRRTLYTN